MQHALLLFLAVTLQAQSSAFALLEEARSQPVEIFAGIAFQLLPHLSPAAKIDTLTEIFERAGEARSSFPSRYPYIDALDALSLRSRAVRTIQTRSSSQSSITSPACRRFGGFARSAVEPAHDMQIGLLLVRRRKPAEDTPHVANSHHRRPRRREDDALAGSAGSWLPDRRRLCPDHYSRSPQTRIEPPARSVCVRAGGAANGHREPCSSRCKSGPRLL
jgi:hypothetical protein